MKTNQQSILHNLLELAREIPSSGLNSKKPASGDSPESTSTSVPGNSSRQVEELTDLPAHLAQTVSQVMATFETLSTEKDRLAEDLLSSYNHLNATFSATLAVATHKNTQEAIRVLLEEIARAVDSPFGYYLGQLTDYFILPDEQKIYGGMAHSLSDRPESRQQAVTFYQNHRTALRQLAGRKEELQVEMIGYYGPYEMDHEGRGNVLVVQLRGNESDLSSRSSRNANQPWELERLGTLIFVRDSSQELFQAIEMNLAGMLGRMGAAVLGNILYAEKIHRFYLESITSLVRAMEAKDEYTSGHSSRVAEMACDLGRYIGLEEGDVKQLEWAGLLHDIGKIGIRDEVLSKPGKLTEEEFDHIKTHPVKSFNVLEPLEALQGILAAVRHHHEHFDGSGYPDGLVGEDIPLHARILQIADVWDALTSTRPYRDALSSEKAQEILRSEAGTTMDPKLVISFLHMMEKTGRL